jgi:two-component system, cell cycle sensor histidine kinase and response regulator CckA
MAADVVRLLLVEDSEDDAVLIASQLRRGGIEVSYDRVDTAGAMIAALGRSMPDLVISDCKMPAFDSQEALRLLHDTTVNVPFIVVSGQIGEEAAADLMRAGAQDFVLKNDLARLAPAVQRELRSAKEHRKGALERGVLERQLHQADRLDSLGQLAGGIAHDFNNLLSVINGYAEFVLAELPADHPCRRDVASIEQAALQAAALTRQLLIFSKVQPAQPETLDLNVVVTDTEQLLRRTIGEDIDIVMRLEPDLGGVIIDRNRLEQIILNLVVNARGAMPDGGRLTIQTATTSEPDQPWTGQRATAGRFVRLTCSDTGCGMSPEVAQRAFEPFFTTKGIGKGSGLGLATVYGAVSEAGGTVSLWSEPGVGTRVTIDLPWAPIRVASADAVREAPHGQGERILVVEDNDGLREIATRILTRAGYEVSAAAARDEALRVSDDKAIRLDLVLTDVIMPGISVQEFIDAVHKTRPGLPVILMSGYATDHARVGDSLPEDFPMLTKPFQTVALLRQVSTSLHGR